VDGRAFAFVASSTAALAGQFEMIPRLGSGLQAALIGHSSAYTVDISTKGTLSAACYFWIFDFSGSSTDGAFAGYGWYASTRIIVVREMTIEH
jgi:hypothetical protein